MMQRRFCNIMIERFAEEGEVFAPMMATALREYADAVEQGKAGNHDCETFETRNECRIKMIAGGMDI